MADYIEREALLAEIVKGTIISDDLYGLGIMAGVEFCTKKVVAAPAADAAPVVHGRWVEREDFNFDVYYDCSACGESFCFIEGVPEENFYRYCPNCGAKMDGGVV